MILYELQKELAEILEDVYNADGELSEELEKRLDTVDGNIDSKLQNWAGFIMQLKSDIEQVKNEERRLRAKKQIMQNALDRSKNNMLFKMKELDIDKSKGYFNISLRNLTKIEYNTEKISEEYFKIKKEIDKTLIKDTLKKGVVIEGVKQYKDKSLSIR